MATKKFVMEIPLILHDMVQEFVVSALSARPSNYVDYAVEYYLQLQTKEDKEDRAVYETIGINSMFRSSGGDSEEVCGDGEAVSDTANVYQVSIHPEAFHSPTNKQFPSDDDDSILTDPPYCDREVSSNNTYTPTVIYSQSTLSVKSDADSLAINTTHTLPTSPPFTVSIQGSSFNAASSAASMSILPVSSPLVSSPTPNLPFNFTLQNPLAVTSNHQLSTPAIRPTTPLPSNSPVSLHVVGERNSPHSSTIASPFKSNFSGLSLNNGECRHSHKHDQNHFQCKTCRGVFKPHPRPAVQPFLSVPNSPSDPLQSHSSASYPERPQLYSILPASHIPNGSSAAYYATSTQPTPSSKSTPELPERKFPCHICERSYKSNTGLKRHLIVHSGERPFQCHYCFKSFYRKYVLTTHISRVHNKIFASSQS